MKKVQLLLSLAFFCLSAVHGQKNNYNLDKAGLAIEGYDPVAYFISQKPVEGKASINYVLNGVTYRFSNIQNRDLFKTSPAKYEPQYGGWCAYAMGAKGEKVTVDPETFKIVDGKLFLFYNHFFNNTLKDWNKDEASLKMKADKNWMKLNP